MANVPVSTEILYSQRKRVNNFRSEYNLDFWWEVRKRWLVLGVLVAVAAAVVAPGAGGPGGIFHTEYVRYLPLTFIYYKAGCFHRYHRQRYAVGDIATAVPPARLLTICILHAHVVAPALCVLTVEAFKGSGLDHRVVKGAVLTSAGAGCGWVSLALRLAPPTPLLVSANYALSLVATPLLMVILCGRAAVPPLGGILSTILISATPFALGALRQNNGSAVTTHSDAMVKISALLLLYSECCEKLREAEGSLFVGDVLVTLILVLSWLFMNAAACWLYERCGVLSTEDSTVTACCAIPRCLDTGWEWSAACGGPGLARLPAALLAPAQALLLAAIVTPEDDITDADEYDDEMLTVVERERVFR